MKIISLGVPELDRSLGGGIPHPSIISIEGEHGSGKTVFSQQIIYHMLKEGMRVYVISTGNTSREYLEMMKSVKLDATEFYLLGKLKFYSLHIKDVKWSEYLFPLFISVIVNFLDIKSKYYDCILIDDLSTLSLKVEPSRFLTFITKVKNLKASGKTIILTFHPKFFHESVIRNLKASSDVYLRLKNASIGSFQVKILEIVKLWGSHGERKGTVILEVNPALGLRVLPIQEVSI